MLALTRANVSGFHFQGRSNVARRMPFFLLPRIKDEVRTQYGDCWDIWGKGLERNVLLGKLVKAGQSAFIPVVYVASCRPNLERVYRDIPVPNIGEKMRVLVRFKPIGLINSTLLRYCELVQMYTVPGWPPIHNANIWLFCCNCHWWRHSSCRCGLLARNVDVNFHALHSLYAVAHKVKNTVMTEIPPALIERHFTIVRDVG